MSRSFRKQPIIKDNGKHKQFGKRQANKKVRHNDCSSGGGFKKLFESWDISDWKFWIKDKSKKEMSK